MVKNHHPMRKTNNPRRKVLKANPKYHVIIIGAGIAGLEAAQFLASQGYHTLILEARDRVGGRIHTIETSQHQFIEVGSASLNIDLEKPNGLVPLLSKLNLSLLPLDNPTMDIFDAKGYSQTLFKLQDYYKASNNAIQKAKKTHWQTWPSIAQVLNYYPDNIPKRGTLAFLARQTITAMIAQHTGVLPQQLSLYEMMLKGEPAKVNYFLNGGYQRLPEAIAKMAMETGNVTIMLNKAVEKVYQDSKTGYVRIVTADHKQYTAHIALCTVPLGVLKQKKLKFFPDLSKEKQNLINHLEIGHHNKVILEFEKPFWKEDIQYLYPGHKNIEEWPEYRNLFYFSQGKIPALVGHFYANAARFHKEDKETIKKALLPLERLYHKKMLPLKAAYVTHWDTDPYTLGSTSCCGIHLNPAELDLFSIPEPGGLYFAGAHTLANNYRETVEGAYRSGLRAAMDIHVHLKSLITLEPTLHTKPKRKKRSLR